MSDLSLLNGVPFVPRTPSRRRPRRAARSTGRAGVVAVAASALSLLLPLVPASANTVAPAGSYGTWTQTMRENFDGALNTNRWGRYTGFPGDYGVWKPSHIEMHGGQCWIHGYREGASFVTGGMMLQGQTRTYGKYLVRARFDRADGVGHAMMLWPKSGWPPEVDFSEGEGIEGRTMATAHWGALNSQQHAFLRVDMRNWHTYGVEWTPTALRYTFDGRVWATMTGKAVPHQPMSLVIQTGADKRIGPITALQPRNVTFAIDWVAVYRYN
jgi:hypothetical protein